MPSILSSQEKANDLLALLTSWASFWPAAKRSSVTPRSSSIAPSAMESSQVATSEVSRSSETLAEDVSNTTLFPTSLFILLIKSAISSLLYVFANESIGCW